ncbi:MAG: hypothetical protein OEZ02_13985 [Anaerolineae bacterium]|nr:hypothetical protein [Anaerolineae bacterium]
MKKLSLVGTTTVFTGLFLLASCSQSASTPRDVDLTDTFSTPTPSTTPSPSLTPTYIPVTPVLAGTPAMNSAGAITIDTLDRLTLFARWGNGNINKVIYTPDGDYLVAGSSLGLYFYNSQDYTITNIIYTETPLFNVIISPDGKLIAANTYDEVLLFDTEEKSHIATYEIDANSLSFSPDGEILVTGRYHKNERFSYIEFWNVTDGSFIRSIESEHMVVGVTLSSDGKYIAANGFSTKLWSIDGNLLSNNGPYTSGGYIPDVAFSPDGKLLVEATDDNAIIIWQITETGGLINYQTIYLSNYPINYSVSLSPDGNLIAAGMREGIHLWNLHSGKIMKKLGTESSNYINISWSPDSKFLVSTTSERGIEVWDIEKEKLLFAPRQISGNFNSLAWSSSDNIIASGTEGGYIYILKAPSGNVMRILDQNYGMNSLSFSPDGRLLAVGHDSHLLQIWNLNGKVLNSFEGSGYGSTSVSFSRDGSLLAAIFNDSGDYMFEYIQIWNVNDWSVNKLFTLGDSGDYLFHNFQLSPDNKIAAIGITDMTGYYHKDVIRIIDMIDGTTLTTLELTGAKYRIFLQDIYMSPDGRYLIAHSHDLEENGSKERIRVWRVSDWEQLNMVEVMAGEPKGRRGYHLNNVITWSPDSAFFALGVRDGSIHIRKGETGELLHSFPAHTLRTTAVAFSPDGHYLVSVSADGTFRLWGVK